MPRVITIRRKVGHLEINAWRSNLLAVFSMNLVRATLISWFQCLSIWRRQCSFFFLLFFGQGNVCFANPLSGLAVAFAATWVYSSFMRGWKDTEIYQWSWNHRMLYCYCYFFCLVFDSYWLYCEAFMKHWTFLCSYFCFNLGPSWSCVSRSVRTNGPQHGAQTSACVDRWGEMS